MEEAAQLREDIRQLRAMMDRVVATDGDRLFLNACGDVLRKRLDRLARVEDAVA